MNAYQIGVVSGFLFAMIGFGFGFFFLRKKVFQEVRYDERQLMEQGKAYKYGFTTALALNMLCSLLYEFDFVQGSELIGHIGCMCLSILVFALYAIWKNAYVGIVDSARKYILLGSFLILCLGCSSIISFLSGSEDSSITAVTDLMISGIWAVIILALILRSKLNQKELDEE